MLIRNAVILGLLAPAALLGSAVPLTLMIGGAAFAVVTHGRRNTVVTNAGEGQIGQSAREPLLPALESPFSLTAAFKFGIIFLVLQIGGTFAQRMLGHWGFYAVSVAGGIVSSASAVASAANLAAAGTLPPQVAGIGAVCASAASALVNLPLVARLAKDRVLAWKLTWVLGGIVVLGALGAIVQDF